MQTEKTYNGWNNYETWNVALWLDNDQGTQERAVELARDVRAGRSSIEQVRSGIWTEQQAEKFQLAKQIEEWVKDEILPDLGATMAADLLNAAVSEVDWDEIATGYLADLDEE